jgi:nitrogen fixation protein NifZ
MRARFDVGAEVRVTRNVRNDGTFPGLPTGDLLVRRGSTGNVVDVGVFLQDQIIYSVHFLDLDRVVGCREEELIAATEPWVPSRFETREKVIALRTLAVNGELRAAAGTAGEVIKVLRDLAGGVQYHVRFSETVLQVPEGALASAHGAFGTAPR